MNINGYRPSHRNKWLLLKHKILNKDELLLFELYLDQMDFDKRHKNYATFEVDFAKIAVLLGYKLNKTNNSIRNKHKKLLKLGFIFPTGNKNIFSVHNPERYVAQTSKWQGKANDFQSNEMNQPIANIIQNIATNIQLNEINLQPIEKKEHFSVNKTTPRTLVSSKVESKFVNDKEISLAEEKSHFTKTTQDYQRIYKENGYTTFTPDLMEWTDDNN